MKWFLKRLSEPTSAAGISGLASGVLACVNGQWQGGAVAIVAALAAFVMPESGTK